MADPRIVAYAKVLTDHSIDIKKGDLIEINANIEARPLVLELCKNILKKGATPRLNVGMPGFNYTYYKHAPDSVLRQYPKIAEYSTKNTAGIISIFSPDNTRELNNVDANKVSQRMKIVKPISELRLKQNNWVLCAFPTSALAQEADMSLEEFEDFVYSAVNVDYNKMKKEQLKIKALYDRSNEIHVVGPETDLYVNIEGRQGILCCGNRNVPDGEVFIGPVETKTEGHISYSFPAIYQGRSVEGVKLLFKKGKAIKATAEKNEAFLNKILDTDKGARYLGEFSFGLNYGIKQHIKEILFDEKIGGTIHLALGMAYKEGGGKNDSAVHWDMIKDMRRDGKVFFDGKLVYKNGKFIRFN